jgi:hypothetical protein
LDGDGDAVGEDEDDLESDEDGVGVADAGGGAVAVADDVVDDVADGEGGVAGVGFGGAVIPFQTLTRSMDKPISITPASALNPITPESFAEIFFIPSTLSVLLSVVRLLFGPLMVLSSFSLLMPASRVKAFTLNPTSWES